MKGNSDLHLFVDNLEHRFGTFAKCAFLIVIIITIVIAERKKVVLLLHN